MNSYRSVLLVETDKSVAASTSSLLHELGWEVFCAGDSMEALDIVELRKTAIDLLMTEVLLTPLTGVQLSQRVRRQHATIKILYMSSVPQVGLVWDSSPQFLLKPFTKEQLEENLNRLWSESKQPVQGTPGITCPSCGSKRVRPSRRHFGEKLLFLFVSFQRCRDCRARFRMWRAFSK